jgi:guanosine-3',5'-bis(diphosphate) 3'-pyrophosphohydrolase
MRAADMAARAHAGQRRKGGDVPYVGHVIEVARLVAEDGWEAPVVAAALLHDVVEDSETTVAEIEAEFGAEVAGLVGALTDSEALAALPRPERKRRQAAHVAGAPAPARAIKIADQTSNLRDLARLPAGWSADDAEAYIAGTARVVAECRAVSPGLAALYDAAAVRARDALPPMAPARNHRKDIA